MSKKQILILLSDFHREILNNKNENLVHLYKNFNKGNLVSICCSPITGSSNTFNLDITKKLELNSCKSFDLDFVQNCCALIIPYPEFKIIKSETTINENNSSHDFQNLIQVSIEFGHLIKFRVFAYNTNLGYDYFTLNKMFASDVQMIIDDIFRKNIESKIICTLICKQNNICRDLIDLIHYFFDII